MVGQTPPASGSGGSGVRTLELVFASVAIFGAAFAVAKAAFERNLPYTPGSGGAVPNPMRRGWSYRPPVKGYTSPGFAPRLGGWPVYTVKVKSAPGGYKLVELEQVPGDRPVAHTIGSVLLPDGREDPRSGNVYRNKNEALYQAGLLVQKYASSNRRNTNVLRVFDEVGQCVYAIQASVHDPGFDELEC